jgi:hypothetical protein
MKDPEFLAEAKSLTSMSIRFPAKRSTSCSPNSTPRKDVLVKAGQASTSSGVRIA